jgi:hypothetical protein
MHGDIGAEIFWTQINNFFRINSSANVPCGNDVIMNTIFSPGWPQNLIYRYSSFDNPVQPCITGYNPTWDMFFSRKCERKDGQVIGY